MKNPETGQVTQVSWDQIQQYEQEYGSQLDGQQRRELERIKRQFKGYRRQRQSARVEQVNRGIDRVSKGAKTFKKGWDRRVVEGGRGRPKTGYWRGGTYYPYQKSYRKKQKSRSKPVYDRSGHQYVIVNGKAYPVGNNQRSRYSKKKKYYKKKKDEPEINGFFNIFG